MSNQNVASIKHIKQAIKYTSESLSEQSPPDRVALQLGFVLQPMVGLTKDEAITRLNKFQQAIALFEDSMSARMVFEITLSSEETVAREKKLIETTQTKLNTWIDLQGKPNEIKAPSAEELKAVSNDTEVQKAEGLVKA